MIQNSILLIAAVVLVVACAGVACVLLLKRQRRQKQLLGLQWLQALRFLLMHVQKHRGLCASFLSGNWGAETELMELKQHISEDIHAVAQLGEWINFDDDWRGITQHWAKLVGSSESMGFPKSFSQHSKLIANILTLLDTLAEHHQLRELNLSRQTSALWLELLWVGEMIGQCRALGVRILSLPTQTRQLEKYKKQIEKALKETTLLLDHPYPRARVSADEIASIHSFIEFVRHNLLEKTGIISANEYFNKATITITIIYECFDREMQNLHRRITA